MEDGGILRRIRVFGAALRRIHSILRDESPCIFHVHFASRGSTLRKCIVSVMVLRTPCWLVLHAHGAGFDGFSRICRETASGAGCQESFVAPTVSWCCPRRWLEFLRY